MFVQHIIPENMGIWNDRFKLQLHTATIHSCDILFFGRTRWNALGISPELKKKNWHYVLLRVHVLYKI